ncbi:hypothetical protein K3W96_15005, partial [Listeria monocytogenes]|nr:hypothetical protein [Listeria monocytogenes]
IATRTVGRCEALIGIIDLREHKPAGRRKGKRSGELQGAGKAADRHVGALLAKEAWKSKQDMARRAS